MVLKRSILAWTILLLVITHSTAYAKEAYPLDAEPQVFDIPEEDLRRYEELYQLMEDNTPEFTKKRRRESLQSFAEIGEFEVKDPKTGGMRKIQYGIPDETVICVKDAVCIAFYAIETILNQRAEDFSRRIVGYWYEISDPEQPSWLIQFQSPSSEDFAKNGDPFFTIQARDGLLTYIEAYDADEAQG